MERLEVILLCFALFFTLFSCTTSQSSGPQYTADETQKILQHAISEGHKKHHKEALHLFEKALQDNPNNPDAYRNAGVALMGLGQHSEAVNYLQEAISLNPKYTEAYINLAAALGRINRASEGLDAFDQAIELDPVLAAKYKGLDKKLWEQLSTYTPTREMETPYQMYCLGIEPPSGDMWSIYNYSTPAEVTFERITERGDEHTVIAGARAVIWDFKTPRPQILKKALEESLQQFRASRYDEFNYAIDKLERYGLPCVGYRFTATDRGVPYDRGTPYLIHGAVTFCPHPKCDLFFELSFSQRHLEKWPPLPLENELKSFLEELELRDQGVLYIMEYTSRVQRNMSK